MMTAEQFGGNLTSQIPQWNYMVDYLSGALTSGANSPEDFDGACLYADVYFLGSGVVIGRHKYLAKPVDLSV